MPVDISQIKAAEFKPMIGQTFSVVVGEQKIQLELSECKVQTQYQAQDFREPFSLIMTSDQGATIPQGTWSFDFAEPVGKVELFMVPVADGKHQISFN